MTAMRNSNAAKLAERGKRRRRRWHCVDCGIDTIALREYYMVRDELWAASGLAPHGGMLCCHCLELPP